MDEVGWDGSSVRLFGRIRGMCKSLMGGSFTETGSLVAEARKAYARQKTARVRHVQRGRGSPKPPKKPPHGKSEFRISSSED